MTEIVGRHDEYASCVRVLDDVAAERFGGLLIRGEPGIGKTTLFRAVLDAAVARGYRVLSDRPAEAEARLSYVALGDLLGDVVDEVLPRLPEVQRRALEVALLRSEPRGALQQRAVAAAFLSAVILLSEDRPVLVAVDDIQWLDLPSSRVLAYAFRRLAEQRTGFVVSLRSEGDRAAAGLARSLPEERTRLVELGPLTIGALHRVLRTQLGEVLPRPLLARVTAASGGNPFFALEIARAVLAVDGRLRPGDALPVPEAVTELLGNRLGALSPASRRVLLAASAMVRPAADSVALALDLPDARSALEEAEDAGIVRLDGGRISFAHPLFASSLYAAAGAATRRRLHRRLADVATDLEERARHLALGAVGPDEDVAQALEAAARAARIRGAPDSAAELGQLSLHLTPDERSARLVGRTMEAADCCFEAGDTTRARRLLEELVTKLAPGHERAEALLRLACVRHYDEDREAAAAILAQALREADAASELQAWIHAVLARTHAWTSDVDTGLTHARTALQLAEQSDDQALLFLALTAVAMCEIFAGNGLPRRHLERALALEEPDAFMTPVLAAWHPWINFASLLLYVEEYETARLRLRAMLQRAIDGGDEGSLPELRFWLGELECRAGNFDLAKHHAFEGYDAALQVGQQLMVAQLSSTKALAHGHLGELAEARAAAEEGLELATALASAPPTIRNLAALGFIELSAGDPVLAADHLRSARALARSTGYREPGQFAFVGNLIEALIGTGRFEEATALTQELHEEGERLGRAWALVSAARGRALMAAAEGRLEMARAAIEEAVDHQSRLPMPFEAGRTLLVKGQLERRLKQRRAARATLGDALAVFETLGANAWAERARGELARLSGRASADALTPTELRVARLVADGCSNKQAAATLFVTVKAIEKNLSSVYAKLGLSSRAQLARGVADGDLILPSLTGGEE